MINEIEYKVVKAIFSVKKIVQVQQIDLSAQDLQVGNTSPNPIQIGEVKLQGGNSNVNPLFSNSNA
ncbi:MAG: hypothetical protein LBU14_05905 [Candidatus Peribacteria bacterium]|nr:hypothetical protein [Candidatus Peribacteria bacterium]